MRKIVLYVSLLLVIAVTWFTVRVSPEGFVPPSDNQVVALHLRSTVWGIEQALAGETGSFMLTKGKDMVLFVWKVEDAWAFAGINVGKAQAIRELATIGNGNLVNLKTMENMLEWLEANGWSVTSPAALSRPARVLITASLQNAASSLPTFLVLPVGLVMPPDSLDKYGIVQEWQ